MREEREREQAKKHSLSNASVSMNNSSSSPPRSMDPTSPPQSHEGHKPSSPIEGSPADSAASSDHHTSHEFFTPKEEFRNSIPPHEPPPSNSPEKTLSPHLSPVVISNRSVRDEPPMMTKVDHNPQDVDTDGVVEEGHVGGASAGGGRRSRPSLSASKRTRKESTVRSALLGFRVCGIVLCLISFSVMAADKNQGWALDSFDRYMEFRYCMAVNVIGFAYSGAQASDVAYHLATGKHVPHSFLRYYFDFFMDQVLSYLLISSSSSAATRVEDWKSNWGKDKFPQMASASVALSFLAFAAFASSSLLSGYGLCTLRSTT